MIQRTYDKRIETIAIVPCHAHCDPNIPFMGKQSLESLTVQLGSEKTLYDFCLDLRKDNLFEIMQDAFACWRGVGKFKKQCKQKGKSHE